MQGVLMKNMILLALLILPLSVQAQLKGVKKTSIDGNKMRDRIASIPNTVEGNMELANLILHRNHVLGDKCTVKTKPKGNFLYTMKVPGIKKGIMVGEKAGTKVGKGKRKKTVYPKRSDSEIKAAKLDLAQKFRDAVESKNKWPCGQPDAIEESYDLNALIDEIDFVAEVDENGQEVIHCMFKEKKIVKVRNPENCQTMDYPVMDMLEDGLCQRIVKLTRDDVESYLIAGTRTKKPAKLPPLKMPKIKKMTKETKNEIKRYKKMNESLPKVMSIVDDSFAPEADDFFDPETISILSDLGYEGGEDENGNFPDKDFDDLSEDVQEKVFKAALTLDEIEGKSEFVQPSDELVELLRPIRQAARDWMKEQTEEIDLVDIPLNEDVDKTFVVDMDGLKDFYGPNLKKLQHCKPKRKPSKPSKIKPPKGN